MTAKLAAALTLLTLLSACRTPQAPSAANQPAAPVVVYVTPTPIPTLVPTAIRYQPTNTPGTDEDKQSAIIAENCELALAARYAAAERQLFGWSHRILLQWRLSA